MEPAQSQAFSEPLLAAMPQLREKPHLGVPSSNPALHLGHEVCNSTTALGLQAALHLERVQSRSTGKERDTESGNDYFGARYYASSMGRMMSPDPHSGTLLHMLNPQRWNMYAYALNNPLLFTDPTGMDAIVVNTTSSALGLGHVGIVSVHSNGSAEYGELGPVHNLAPFDRAQVNVTPLATKLSFGQDGKPTQGSMDALRKELATGKHVDAKDIRLLDYKTTDAEATNLDHFMEFADLDSRFNWNTYFAAGPSCIDFVGRGLINAGVKGVKTQFVFGITPNWIFDWLSSQQGDPQGKGTVRVLPGFTPANTNH